MNALDVIYARYDAEVAHLTAQMASQLSDLPAAVIEHAILLARSTDATVAVGSTSLAA